jgi:hypothetical protein
MGLPLGLV